MDNNTSSSRAQQQPNYGVKALSKVLPVAIAITLINGLVFVIFYRRKAIRTTSNYLLLSLAVCDFLTGTINIPYFILFSIFEPLAASAIFHYGMFILHTLMAVSAAYHILAITVEKYLAIIRPLRHYLVTKKTVWKILVGIWITSAFIAALPISWSESKSRDIWYIIHATLCIVLVFLVPYTFMIYAFTAMFKVIAKRKRPSVDSKSSRLQRKNIIDQKCILVFALMSAIFAVCWLPYFSLMLAIFVKRYFKSSTSELMDIAVEAFVIIRYTTSITNPLLYTFFKRDFRLALRNRPIKRGSTSIPLRRTSK